MAHGPGDVARARSADRAAPESDADHAALRGDRPDLVVAQIARALAGSAHAGVRDDQRFLCDRQDIANQMRRGVREIDDHPPLFHALHDGASEWSQSAALAALIRAAEIVVELMNEAGHAIAGIEEAIDVFHVAFQRMQTFEGEHAPDHGSTPADDAPEIV